MGHAFAVRQFGDHALAGQPQVHARGAVAVMIVRPPVPHVAMRPLWRCRNCGGEWPCQPAKLALLAECRTNRTALLIYLGTLMHEATNQLTRTIRQPE
ncbi:hypothetical protein [Micromonospora sp. WMMD710]|uniref:hypothetical protein n=1 Tax=Micromonospora sp. WMMD710 TaxID=3016085 RepID=UPI00241612C7|nr:hypothetical protein [Micromonospora sp. WMMD710]MDG4757208.1 hypothetical protein [Micromonospora sp. WMMD710]